MVSNTCCSIMLQAYTELQPFSLDLTSSSNFKGLLDLSAAPILFHLQSDPELLEYIRSCQDDAENLNSKQVMLRRPHFSPFVCDLEEKLKCSIRWAAVLFFESKIGLGLFLSFVRALNDLQLFFRSMMPWLKALAWRWPRNFVEPTPSKPWKTPKASTTATPRQRFKRSFRSSPSNVYT